MALLCRQVEPSQVVSSHMALIGQIRAATSLDCVVEVIFLVLQASILLRQMPYCCCLHRSLVRQVNKHTCHPTPMPAVAVQPRPRCSQLIRGQAVDMALLAAWRLQG